MTFIPKQNLSQTKFRSLKTSEKSQVVNLKSIYGVSNLRDVSTVAGSGTVTNTNGEYKLTTTANGADSAQLDSSERGRYLASQEAEAGIGVRISDTPTGSQVVTWGYFDDNEGFGFGKDATGVYVFTRTGGVDTIVRQANWNLDTLDGNGSSGLTLDVSLGYVYHINFVWYGLGPIDFIVYAFDTTTREQKEIIVHRVRKESGVSVKDPNLPIRAKVINGGTANAFDSVFVTGRQFSTVGRFDPSRRITSERRLSLGSVSTTVLPLVTFRRKSAFQSVAAKVEGFDIITDQNLVVEIRLNGSLTGASYGTPTNHTASETGLEADVSATAISGGEVLWVGLVSSSGFGSNRSGDTSRGLLPLDLIQTQPVSICARRAGASDATVTTVFRILEEW